KVPENQSAWNVRYLSVAVQAGVGAADGIVVPHGPSNRLFAWFTAVVTGCIVWSGYTRREGPDNGRDFGWLGTKRLAIAGARKYNLPRTSAGPSGYRDGAKFCSAPCRQCKGAGARTLLRRTWHRALSGQLCGAVGGSQCR